MLRSLAVLCALCLIIIVPASAAGRHRWGRIANGIHQGEPIYCALLFAGPPNPHSLPLYTRHPRDADKLNWTGDASIDFALGQMTDVGLNTVKLSYWGHEGETDGAGPAWLFSQTRWPGDAKPGPYTEAEQVALARHFFDRARAGGLLVAPMLEVSAKFPFWAEYPASLDNLIARATWLLKNFGDEPNWLRVYDVNGQPRHVLWLIETIHGGAIDPNTFADGFGTAATRLKQTTGFDVGFILDPTPLPAYGSEVGPDPDSLKKHASVLAINPFNITSQGVTYRAKLGDITDEERQQYAESVLRRWAASGIPLIAPLMPGYDGHIVFPGTPVYGFTDAWRARQKALALLYETDGLSFDCWNGWTEGYAIPPSVEEGDTYTRWAREAVTAARATSVGL